MADCPSCRSPLPEGARYCPQCGTALSQGAGQERLDDEVRELLRSGYRIAAVKRVRVVTGVDLRSAKEHVDRIEAQMPPGSMRRRSRISPAGCLAFLVVLAAALLWWLQRFGSPFD